MLEKVNYDQLAIDGFEKVTQYDLSSYFVKVNKFFEDDYSIILSWYSGSSNFVNSTPFENLKKLITESDKVNSLFGLYKESLSMGYYWDLIDKVQDIKDKLETSNNLSKYTRSTRTANSYSTKPEYDYTMKSHETLENVQYKNISSEDFDNQWIEIAMRNNLSELNYDTVGGKILKLPMNFSAYFLESVIDNLSGEKLYGKDIQKKLEFVDNDLKILSYTETFIQAIKILISIRLGTVPEYPTLGYQQELVVGTNLASFNLPILSRQLKGVFKTDDTVTLFDIKKIERKDDAISLSFVIQSIYGDIYQDSKNLL